MAHDGSPAAGGGGGRVPTVEEMTGQARESVRARRAEVIDGLGPEAVLWLAAPPVWNRDAAEGAGFPATPLDDFVLAARAKDWCKVRGIMVPGDRDLVFWMPDEVRPAVTGILGGRPGAGVADTARMIAGRVASLAAAAPHDSELPGALAAWARLAGEPDPYGALARQSQEVMSSGNRGAVQDLLFAARALPAVFGPGGEEQAESLSRALHGPRPGGTAGRPAAGRRTAADSGARHEGGASRRGIS